MTRFVTSWISERIGNVVVTIRQTTCTVYLLCTSTSTRVGTYWCISNWVVCVERYSCSSGVTFYVESWSCVTRNVVSIAWSSVASCY